MTYEDLVDTKHDATFLAVPNLRWLPWIGRRFADDNSAKRCLLVGESHYARANESESLETVRIKHEGRNTFTRDVIWESPISQDWKNPTLGNIPRLLFNSPDYRRTDFWQNVAFYNLVQRMVCYTDPPERPTWADYVQGWEVFCYVVNILRPDYCVILGSEAQNSFWSVMSTRGFDFTAPERRQKIGRFWGYRASIQLDSTHVPIIFTKHPGRYFSSQRWHKYLSEEIPTEVEALKSRYLLS